MWEKLIHSQITLLALRSSGSSSRGRRSQLERIFPFALFPEHQSETSMLSPSPVSLEQDRVRRTCTEPYMSVDQRQTSIRHEVGVDVTQLKLYFVNPPKTKASRSTIRHNRITCSPPWLSFKIRELLYQAFPPSAMIFAQQRCGEVQSTMPSLG